MNIPKEKRGRKNKPHKGTFTRAHWDRWLAELNGENPHPHADKLRAGLAQLRSEFAARVR